MLRIFVYSRGVDRFLREIGPDVIILPELNVGTLSTIFVAKGKRNRVPAVVVPFAIPNPTEPAAYYGNDPLHRADRPLGRVLGRLYPQWRFEHEGKKRLRLPPLVASILKILWFSTRATWILNRGDAAAIALDSEAQRDFYLHPGFPRDQLKVTGDLNYCVPFRDEAGTCGRTLPQARIATRIASPGMRLPPDQYSSTNTRDFEFSSYASVIKAWIAALG